MEKDNKEPPAYTEQPLPATNFTPAQTYQHQQYPAGPTQPPQYPPYIQQQLQPQPAATTGACVIINSTAQHQYIPVGRDPTLVRCPSCHSDVLTSVQTAATGRTHLIALFLCLVGCWPCVCIPYCMDSCKSANHYCPVCNAFIGSRRD